VLTIAFTYPVVPSGHACVGDNPDTHFYMWMSGRPCVLHQPLAIFDANIYYPNRLTLAGTENQIAARCSRRRSCG
jgi:hypothetical protein